MIQYTSEFSEDRWLDENYHLPDKGVYVDVGCAWPDLRSNTAFLRDRGWTGIAVDGNNFWRPYWGNVRNATFINAVVSNSPKASFSTDGPPDMARVGKDGTAVDCVPLEHLLVAHGIEKIDLLSLDCEGGEINALLSMNINLHRPEIVISEFNTFGVGEDYRVKEYLEAVGYSEVHRTTANIIFCA